MMQTSVRLTIREVPWSNPVGAGLRSAQQAELDSLFGTRDHEPGPPPTEADMAVFLLAVERASGQPLGCGGLRKLDGTTAEIKRVYVLPHVRGSGVSGAILAALEERAAEAGYTEIRAEAGAAQLTGMRFYEREGYLPVSNYGPYAGAEGSRCYAKRLPAKRFGAGGH